MAKKANTIENSITRATRKVNNRKYPNGKLPRPDNYEIRKREADERREAWNALKPAEKLAILDRRLGVGIGATKQRAKLQLAINASATTSSQPR
jgi:hypothetical protein